METIDLIKNPSESCRVCGEHGVYDLCEMKFRCNDIDVMLIDAFNCFSKLNNVSYNSDKVMFPFTKSFISKLILSPSLFFSSSHFLSFSRIHLRFICANYAPNH